MTTSFSFLKNLSDHDASLVSKVWPKVIEITAGEATPESIKEVNTLLSRLLNPEDLSEKDIPTDWRFLSKLRFRNQLFFRTQSVTEA